MFRSIALVVAATFLSQTPGRAEIVVLEGESFKPQDAKGWKLTHQDDSYGSHTYGGMWMTHGACLGAAADSAGSVATRSFTIKEAGKFRVWSKYQAPPYFNYLHEIEISQGGKTVFKHVFGKVGTPRLWSFSGVSDELWWPWGVDHDAAEGAAALVDLQAGPVEARLTTIANPKPAGDRFVDFIVLTTNPKDEYQGFKPYSVGSPFAMEALAATELYLRFQNTTDKPAQLTIHRNGHFQPQYGGANLKAPDKAVEPGQWGPWVNIGPFCRLVHDEGLMLTLPGATNFGVQVARDAGGKDIVGDMKIAGGDWIVVPIDITWHKDARVRPSKELALDIIAESKKWRKANGGKKPQEVLFYGAFSGKEEWVSEFKAALGYNTLLPEKYEQVKRAGLHAHAHNPKEIEAFAKKLADKDSLRVLSFGDEISLGGVNFKDPKNNEKFRAWLRANKITKADLGVAPGEATLTAKGDARLVWHSAEFSNQERFAVYRDMTKLTKDLIGPHVLTGANYSPHHGCLYYGAIPQWIDIFKHNGMSMFWAEDYIFSVPEPPQIISWMFAQIRCATKYHNQPIHYYVMPHAPGQEPGFFRRNTLLAIGNGTRHIDNFWVAPAERFTENYVGWGYRDMFRAISEAIYDTAEVEKITAAGKVRPARVALVLSKATDFNESRLMIDKSKDMFASKCLNAPAAVNQTLCRKEQQMLYLALRHAQHAVDLVTEEDILEGGLKELDVVYFAGEWMDHRIVPKLDAWVKEGGVLYACAGLGLKNQFDEPNPEALKLLGLKDAKTTKNAHHLRTLLELPLCEPIGTAWTPAGSVPAVALKQVLTPDDASPIAKWGEDGAAATIRSHGKGVVLAVGLLPGTSYYHSGVRPIPWARGGRHMVYNPTKFNSSHHALALLGVELDRHYKDLEKLARKLPAFSARVPARAVECSNPLVEATLLDGKEGTLLTLTNWTNAPIKNLEVTVRLPFAPKEVRSVEGQRNVRAEGDGVVTRFAVDLAEADYIILKK